MCLFALTSGHTQPTARPVGGVGQSGGALLALPSLICYGYPGISGAVKLLSLTKVQGAVGMAHPGLLLWVFGSKCCPYVGTSWYPTFGYQLFTARKFLTPESRSVSMPLVGLKGEILKLICFDSALPLPS